MIIDGYQLDTNGRRVRIHGKMMPRGTVYLHHDTCKCHDVKPLKWFQRIFLKLGLIK